MTQPTQPTEPENKLERALERKQPSSPVVRVPKKKRTIDPLGESFPKYSISTKRAQSLLLTYLQLGISEKTACDKMMIPTKNYESYLKNNATFEKRVRSARASLEITVAKEFHSAYKDSKNMGRADLGTLLKIASLLKPTKLGSQIGKEVEPPSTDIEIKVIKDRNIDSSYRPTSIPPPSAREIEERFKDKVKKAKTIPSTGTVSPISTEKSKEILDIESLIKTGAGDKTKEKEKDEGIIYF